jgi:outer membrane lipoprotein-sorting protein
MPPPRSCAVLNRIVSRLVIVTLLVVMPGVRTSAQTQSSPPIKVETNEVVLPIEVIQENKSVGAAMGANGQVQTFWALHSKEVTGLSPKSVHIFDDGMKMPIQHFSVEKIGGWEVRDNFGHHLNSSCTPRGIWVGADLTNKTTINDSNVHTYLVTYIPRPSPAGSCHEISVKVDRRHSIVFAPNQYCNTKEPLSDPLRQTEIGEKLLAHVNSMENVELPVSVQAVPFSGRSDGASVDIAARLPASLLHRSWDGIHLATSIDVLGLIFDKSDRLTARFSDFACAPDWDYYVGPLPIPAFFKEVDEQTVIPGGYETQVDLDAGDYRLELLLTDGEKFGRADTSFTVPDFASSTLSMSGIALCKRYHQPLSNERGPTRAPRYVPLMFDGLEFTPAGQEEFKKGEQLMTYVEIYSPQPASTTPPELFLEMKVINTKSGEVRIGTGPRPVSSSGKLGNTVPVVWTMEIDKLPPGAYQIQARASDSKGTTSEWRLASFVLSGSSAEPQNAKANAIGNTENANFEGVSPIVLSQDAQAQELTASDLLKKIAETYGRVSSFSAIAEKKVELDTDTSGKMSQRLQPNVIYAGSEESDEIQITLMASSSSKAKLLLKDGKKELAVVSDGKVVWTLLPTEGVYTEVAANNGTIQRPVDLLQFGGNVISGVHLLGEYETLIAARYRSISSYGRWAKLENSETLKVGKDKKECYVLTIQEPGAVSKQKFWVDKTEFVIWKSVDTRTNVNTIMSGTFDPGISLQTTVTLTIKQMALNPSLGDSNFVFTAPGQVKKVDSLTLSGKNLF